MSILSCCCCCCYCCLILLLLGEFGLNTQYLLLEVNWLGFCNSVFFVCLFYILFISASASVVVCCDTVVSIYSAYCLLLFVYWFVLLCLIWRQKQNLLNICMYLCMYVTGVGVCMWKKEKCFSDKRKIKLKRKKLQMLNTTSSLVCARVLSVVRTLYCCFAFDQCYYLSACMLCKGCIFVWILCTLSVCFSLNLHIMTSVCVCVC